LQFVDLVIAEAMHAVAHAGTVGSTTRASKVSRDGAVVIVAAAAAFEKSAIGVGVASRRGLMLRAEELVAKRREETSSERELGRFCMFTIMIEIV
jgi:hypothetical protein